jgi:hypothetical protein
MYGTCRTLGRVCTYAGVRACVRMYYTCGRTTRHDATRRPSCRMESTRGRSNVARLLRRDARSAPLDIENNERGKVPRWQYQGPRTRTHNRIRSFDPRTLEISGKRKKEEEESLFRSRRRGSFHLSLPPRARGGGEVSSRDNRSRRTSEPREMKKRGPRGCDEGSQAS